MKDKIDFKIVNIAIIMFIFFIVYQTSNFWLGALSKCSEILLPFFFAFIIAYALNPFLRFLQSKKIPKALGVVLILLLVIGAIIALGWIIFPIVFKELPSLFDGIINFIKGISLKFNIKSNTLQDSLTGYFNVIISDMGNGAFSLITNSLGIISTVLISFSAMIYFLIDMDKIKHTIKVYSKQKSKKVYKYLKILDEQMNNYLSGFFKIMIISFFEYTIVFLIIGHPNALLLGCIAAISNLIPYFGGVITNLIAAITAYAISPALFIRTIIVFIILSQVDGYLINPLVYGKTNNVKPLIVIFAIFAGGILFGFTGIILALPSAIILITTYRYFEDDINDKLDDMKINRSIKKKE